MIDQPHLLLMVLAVGAAIGIGVERFVETQKTAERRAYWRGRKEAGAGNRVTVLKPRSIPPPKGSPERATLDAAEQLRCVMEADFKARPLLNKPERRLLSVIDKALQEERPGWRAMGQVALGEVLWSEDKAAFWAINAKRVDLLIVDEDCHPLHAVEFQGTGHHLGDETAARDAVKKEALRRAGIGYVEVVSGDTPAQVRDVVKRLAGRTG
ncbi:DUF2726 domain-containing protein [Novosphingobium sp. KCTC 2891]|uniref:DUF2726 domain-containing protein n=1 Tax=Novosphingobium sp. KCTC 2891 TaxID=2989730 RepID=UPI002221D1DD|nr:DUF2726 domain-containing protein [Novosphingobium sp. KCTC 2891]MCW1384241.1 DUF2726 domain-containing protein [Novosphingobium sp. KCTC 2891]